MALLITAPATAPAPPPAARRVAEVLARALDDNGLVWLGLPLGPGQVVPDIAVLHPAHGLLLLAVRDGAPEEVAADLPHPIEMVRQQAQHAVDALQRDPYLVHTSGRWKGMLTVAWSYGAVLTGTSRDQLDAQPALRRPLEAERLVCQDELADTTALPGRLWAMFPALMRAGAALSAKQLDRVRWNLFAELRMDARRYGYPGPHRTPVYDDQDPAASPPEKIRVLDPQQELLARQLANPADTGHRVVHGVAGSGKTMLLVHRAETLARALAQRTAAAGDTAPAAAKPILVLTFNEPLAAALAAWFVRAELDTLVQVHYFRRWCHQQLVSRQLPLPDENLGRDARAHDTVLRVMNGVDSGAIPAGQYHAVLVDEAHELPPAWLQLAARMADPDAGHRLLLLFDGAQASEDQQRRAAKQSLKSVGILPGPARTTRLLVNHRSPRPLLQAALGAAGKILRAPREEDGERLGQGPADLPAANPDLPVLYPRPGGRDGHPPLPVSQPTLLEESYNIADILAAAHRHGVAWSDMAILCRHPASQDDCAAALARRQLPHQVRRRPGDFDPGADAIHVMTLQASKGLEFGFVVLPRTDAAELPAGAPGTATQDDPRENARLAYLGMTRSTARLVLGVAAEVPTARSADAYPPPASSTSPPRP